MSIKRVFERMADTSGEVELKSEKIELNVAKSVKAYAKDLTSHLKKSDSLFNKLEKAYNTYSQLQSESVELNSLSKSWLKGAKDVASRAEKASKELGISPSELDRFSELIKLIDTLEGDSKLFKDFKKI